MGRKPAGMSDEDFRAYVKRQGQEVPPEIEQYMPDGPPVLTEREKEFGRKVAREQTIEERLTGLDYPMQRYLWEKFRADVLRGTRKWLRKVWLIRS